MRRGRIIVMLVWGVLIFYQGTRSGEVSLSQSDAIVNQIMERVPQQIKSSSSEEKPDKIEETIQKSMNQLKRKVSYWVRKSAHFLEYLILAVLLYWMFSAYPLIRLNVVIYSLFIVLLCAVLDEYFQSFVERTSSVEVVR